MRYCSTGKAPQAGLLPLAESSADAILWNLAMLVAVKLGLETIGDSDSMALGSRSSGAVELSAGCSHPSIIV